MGISGGVRELRGDKNPNWKGGQVTLTCARCGGTFSVRPCRATRAKTCSLVCWNAIQAEAKHKRLADKPAKSVTRVVSEETRRRISVGLRTRRGTAESILAARSVEAESGCVEWTGRVNKHGYGTASYHGKPWLAHRLAWCSANGEIPEGMVVCHHCDNPRCINVGHLFLGYQADNVQDMMKKGRHRVAPVYGERNHYAKLAEGDVQAIRDALSVAKPKDGTARRLALKYGVSEACISSIRSGKRWARQSNEQGPV